MLIMPTTLSSATSASCVVGSSMMTSSWTRESQAVPAHSLGEILGQLAAVGLGFPPAARVPLLISNAVIRRGAGVGVEELAPAGQLYGQKREGKAPGHLFAERHSYSGNRSPAGADGVHRCVLHPAPELADAGVLPAPAVHDVL